MVSCANITLEKIRAEISMGSLTFETPDIKSFNVTRSRSQLAATFSASIQVPVTTVFPIDQQIVIRAGTEGNEQTIFTGNVLSITVNPAFERADSYVVNLSGADRLQELEGKTVSRRQRTRAAQTFAAITSVTPRPQKGISLEKRVGTGGGSERITSDNTNLREHSKLVKTDRVAWDPFHTAKDPEDLFETEDTAATGENVIDIKPRTVALAPGVSVRFNVENTTYEAGDSWAVSDSRIGTIQDQQDGTAIYTQQALGENTITYTKAGATNTFIGKATAVGIPIHDHSSLGTGGPAFGVYGSE